MSDIWHSLQKALGLNAESISKVRAMQNTIGPDSEILYDAPVPLDAAKLLKLVKLGRFAPKIFYHGSPASFQEFDPSKLKGAAFGKGIYLTESPSMASVYAAERIPFTKATEYSPNIRPYIVDEDLTKVDTRRITGQLRKLLSKAELPAPATYYPDVKEMVVKNPESLTPLFSERGQIIKKLLQELQLLK